VYEEESDELFAGLVGLLQEPLLGLLFELKEIIIIIVTVIQILLVRRRRSVIFHHFVIPLLLSLFLHGVIAVLIVCTVVVAGRAAAVNTTTNVAKLGVTILLLNEKAPPLRFPSVADNIDGEKK
jgi:hypothetical protein